MGSEYRTNKDELGKMCKQLKLVQGTSVEVGVLKGEHKWLAGIHEFGCDIPVTDKMRRYLAAQGLHLKKTTTHIHIPERSFLRAGYDQNRDAVLKKANLLLADVAAGRMSPEALYKAVGLELSTAIKDYATELREPPNHPFTVEQKGSSNPLVDSGDMIEGITWRKGE